MTAVEKRVQGIRSGVDIAGTPELARRLLKEIDNFSAKRIIGDHVAYLHDEAQKNRLTLALRLKADEIESYKLERDGGNINHIVKLGTSRTWVLMEEAKGNLAEMLAGDANVTS